MPDSNNNLGDILVAPRGRLLKESRPVDYKERINLGTKRDVAEVAKDMAAMANTVGGQIAIGINKQHQRVGMRAADLHALTPEDLSNKTCEYFDPPFDCDLQILRRSGKKFAIITVPKIQEPYCVMKRDGTYETATGKTVSAFRRGDILVRHGAKSERANRSDLLRILDAYVKTHRKQILEGVSRVIRSPVGSIVTVTSPGGDAIPASTPVHVSDDPSSLPVRTVLDTTGFDDINQQLIGHVKLWNTNGSLVDVTSLYQFYCARERLDLDEERLLVLLRSSIVNRAPTFFWASRLSKRALNRLVDEVAASRRAYVAQVLPIAFALDRTDILSTARQSGPISVRNRASKFWSARTVPRGRRLPLLAKLQGGNSFYFRIGDAQQTYRVTTLIGNLKETKSLLNRLLSACDNALPTRFEERSAIKRLDAILYVPALLRL